MPIKLTEIPKYQRTRVPIEDISPDVITAVNESLDFCEKNPDRRVAADFESVAEAEEFLTDARSYAYQADPRLVVSGNVTRKGGGPKRDLPQARFTVALWVSGDAETSETTETTESTESDAA
jgi:hypothetical protein